MEGYGTKVVRRVNETSTIEEIDPLVYGIVWKGLLCMVRPLHFDPTHVLRLPR